MYNNVGQLMSDKDFIDLLKDVKSEVIGVSTKVDTLYTKMFVGNGQRSFDARMTMLENDHKNCPARLAIKAENKAIRISYAMAFFSFCALIISLIVFIRGS
jgi:hypothetical protein